jgi:hypothetical protein
MNPDKIIFYEQPIMRTRPECYQSIELVNKGYPPTLLCNFKDDHELGVFHHRAQDTYYRMKYNIDSDSQLRSSNSRYCNPCDFSKCSEMANNQDQLHCALNARFKMGCRVQK